MRPTRMSSRLPSDGGPMSSSALSRFVFAVIIFASVHWAAQPPSNVETIDASRLHLSGEFMEANLGTALQPRRIGDRPRHRAAVFVRARVHRRADRHAGGVPRDESRCRSRLSDRRHQRQQHGGSRIRRRGAHAVRQARRAPDAVPRILQRRSRRHVGARQGRRSRRVRACLRRASRGRPVYGSNRLVLAHFWAAFAAFAVAIPLGAWQMLVRSPLHRWVDPELYYRAVTAHGTTLAYVFPTLIAMGFGYAVCAVSLGRPMHGMRLAWVAFWMVIARRRDGDGDRGRRRRDSALHVLSAADRQRLVLPWRADRGRRLVDLDRADGLALRALEARPSGPAGSACDVRDDGRRAAVGVDVAWASARRSSS